MKSAFWNSVFGIFFAALVIKGAMLLTDGGRFMPTVSLLDLTLMALATFRLVRLVSYDVITKFIRDAVATAPRDSFTGTFSQLINCPWCTGLWFSFFVVFAYFATPVAWPIILVLALAGVASFFQVVSNLVGWHAEGKKREVLGPSEPSVTKCG
ncbi:MAG TPA: DUF1360 domain-containing protein [Candidatus Paceibacterota bacterium]|nr:DUF1360 domain-containing protein [Candidatus Paceibacterota bacterium]